LRIGQTRESLTDDPGDNSTGFAAGVPPQATAAHPIEHHTERPRVEVLDSHEILVLGPLPEQRATGYDGCRHKPCPLLETVEEDILPDWAVQRRIDKK
jgi:hypothetical protein